MLPLLWGHGLLLALPLVPRWRFARAEGCQTSRQEGGVLACAVLPTWQPPATRGERVLEKWPV